MSHCTSFKMEFVDKRILYRAMKNLNLKPENRLWAEYSSHFKKKLSLNGKIIGRLLTGTFEDINIFFTEIDNKLIPNFESSTINGENLTIKSKNLLYKLRMEYIKCAIYNFSDKLISSGLSVNVHPESFNDKVSYTINIGDYNRKFSVVVNSNGEIEEKVEGINGQACLDLSQILEKQLSNTDNFNRILTEEYEITVEDQVLQVFRVIE